MPVFNFLEKKDEIKEGVEKIWNFEILFMGFLLKKEIWGGKNL